MIYYEYIIQVGTYQNVEKKNTLLLLLLKFDKEFMEYNI